MLVICVLFSAASAVGQSSDCPGFKNPSSFVTGSTKYFWSARVGERCHPQNYNDTTTGYYIMSTCADPNAQVISANNITSNSYNSGGDNLTEGCAHNFYDANDSRFQIINNTNGGIDQYEWCCSIF